MHTIGISITRDRIFAVALDASTPVPRIAAAVSVPCTEPFGTAGGRGRAFGGAPRSAAGGPPAGRGADAAAADHVPPADDAPGDRSSEGEGDPPGRARGEPADRGRGDPVRSPAGPARKGRDSSSRSPRGDRSWKARRNDFGAAGIRVDRVVTDPVALLLLAPEVAGAPLDGVYLSTFNDILLLRVSGGGVTARAAVPPGDGRPPRGDPGRAPGDRRGSRRRPARRFS